MGRNTEREAIKKVYKSKQWSDKVNKMTDDQVVAIYLRLKSQNKL
jgi:hypothetical protein